MSSAATTLVRSSATAPPTTDDGRRRWGLLALAAAVLVVAVDTTVVVTALPTLAQQLAASTNQLQWVMNGYTLALAGLILPAGALGDRLGRRRVLLAGLVVFGASSLLASQVASADGLVAVRVLMGVGGAAIIPLSLSLLPAMFSAAERARAVAVLAAVMFLGLPLGPLVAGWLLTRYAWGAIFLINLPIVAVAVVGVARFVPESRHPSAPPIDLLGTVLSISGVTALVYGVVEQPAQGWTGLHVLGGIGSGVVLLTAFLAWQVRTGTPLIDLALFRQPRFSWSSLAFVVVGFALGGVLFILTPFLQIVQGYDPQETGVRLLPMIAGVVIGALPNDRLAGRLGTRFMIAAGLAVSAAGSLLLSRAGADTGFGAIALAEAVLGLGMGLAMPAAVDAILGIVPTTETGMGVGLTRTLQFVAMSFGVAILGSILDGTYQRGLDGHLTGLPAQIRAAAEQSVAGAGSVPHLAGAARIAYASGMSEVMLVTASVLSVAAVLVALFLPARSAMAPAPMPAG